MYLMQSIVGLLKREYHVDRGEATIGTCSVSVQPVWWSHLSYTSSKQVAGAPSERYILMRSTITAKSLELRIVLSLVSYLHGLFIRLSNKYFCMAYSSNCLNNFFFYDSDQFFLPVFITDTEGVAEKYLLHYPHPTISNHYIIAYIL